MNSYTKTEWANGGTPPISAQNLNKIEQGIYDNRLYKQDWFVADVDYDVASVKLNSTDEVVFNGKFRFTPDPNASANQYDLINRQMLTAILTTQLANKQNKFCAVDPTTSGYYDLANVDNIKVRLYNFKAIAPELSTDDEDIMNRAMVGDYISANFGTLFDNYLKEISGFDISKNQTLHHEPGGAPYWVDDEV